MKILHKISDTNDLELIDNLITIQTNRTKAEALYGVVRTQELEKELMEEMRKRGLM